MTKKIPDHIEEYFASQESSGEAIASRQIFSATEEDIDLKTDLNENEIPVIAVLKYNDEFLKSKGIKPVFTKYANYYMRLKVSKDRKSREEFVNINKKDNQEDMLGMAGNLANIGNSRK